MADLVQVEKPQTRGAGSLAELRTSIDEKWGHSFEMFHFIENGEQDEDVCEKLAKSPFLTKAGGSVSWKPGTSRQPDPPVQFVKDSFFLLYLFLTSCHNNRQELMGQLHRPACYIEHSNIVFRKSEVWECHLPYLCRKSNSNMCSEMPYALDSSNQQRDTCQCLIWPTDSFAVVIGS